MKPLQTERVYLRELQEEDATETYAGWLNDPDINEFLETRHTEQNTETCRAFIRQCNADPASHLFGIFLRENDKHIGNGKLGALNPYHKTAQLSYFIGDKSEWRKGLAEEAQYALLSYGFNVLKLERIEGGIIELNLAALRVALKNGFSIDGFLRKHMEVNGRRVGCFWVGILKNELPER